MLNWGNAHQALPSLKDPSNYLQILAFLLAFCTDPELHLWPLTIIAENFGITVRGKSAVWVFISILYGVYVCVCVKKNRSVAATIKLNEFAQIVLWDIFTASSSVSNQPVPLYWPPGLVRLTFTAQAFLGQSQSSLVEQSSRKFSANPARWFLVCKKLYSFSMQMSNSFFFS